MEERPESRADQFRRRASNFGGFLRERANSLKETTVDRFTFDGELKAALGTLQSLVYPDFQIANSESKIPHRILLDAKGLVLMTQVQAGFLFSGKGGSGLVINKLPNGQWSGPSLFGMAGVGAGLLVGMSRTNMVILLNTDAAVKVFMGKGQVKLGADLEIAAGPIGRHAGGAAQIGKNGVQPSFAYSHSKGLYAGVSIDGTVLLPRSGDNAKFYGRPVTTQEILTGGLEPPRSMILQDLYSLLAKVEKDAKNAKRLEQMKDAVTPPSSVMAQGAMAAAGLK